MARPIKDGVDYFPKDTDFYSDDKVRLLRAEFGAKGMYILDYLLCDLYNKNGYFLKWDKNKCFLVSDGAGCGCSPEYIMEFINGCLRCSFFDEGVFKMFGVLTSKGIQRRYIRMFKSRDEIRMIKEYFLLDTSDKNEVPTGILNKLTLKNVSCTENPVKSTENPVKSTDNSQKEKERESKKKKKDTKVSKDTGEGVIPTEIKAAFDDFIRMRKMMKKPMTDEANSRAIAKLNTLAPNDFKKQIAILNQSVDRGWSGLYELKEERIENNGNNSFQPSRR